MTLPYRALWERELREGKHGQDRRRPSTWRMDALYHAACWQLRSEDAEDILATALENGAHPDSIAALVDNVHDDREMADRVFVERTEAERAA